MRCTGKAAAFVFALMAGVVMMTGCQADSDVVEYESKNYNTSVYEGKLFAEDLCVSESDVKIDAFQGDSSLHASALFDVDDSRVLYASDIHEKLYPASTTKVLTALVAIEQCEMDEKVTVGVNGAASSFDADASVGGLEEGDVLTVQDLLNGLLLPSGNDCAVAIAEYVGGSTEEFVTMMNEKAAELGATNSHFVTPNGLHDDDHYTTAYDMYLIFNECIKHQEFMDVISASSYTADVTGADGTVRQLTWEPTSYYAKGAAALPDGATVIGGKTGYTGEAGNCLVLLDQDDSGKSYISIVMGADSKPLLYEDMTDIIDEIPEVTGTADASAASEDSADTADSGQD